MKRIIIPAFFVSLLATIVPFSASALSCMPQEMMFEQYLSEGEYIIMTATPIEEVDHVTEESEQFPGKTAGYLGQFLDVEAIHKGSFTETGWVYARRDATWDYLCAGRPPVIGSTAVYVIRSGGTPMELDSIMSSFPVDSQMGKRLLAEVADLEEEPSLTEWTEANHADNLEYQIRELVSILRIKLAEWRFWRE